MKKVMLNTDLIYPVGSLYFSANDVNPHNLFGGEWEQIKDTFLLACGDNYKNGATGGEVTHKLVPKEIPGNFLISQGTINKAWCTGAWGNYSSSAYVHSSLLNTGIGCDIPHNNMPPYLAVYVWQRIN